jgi:hypothetical protein
MHQSAADWRCLLPCTGPVRRHRLVRFALPATRQYVGLMRVQGRERTCEVAVLRPLQRTTTSFGCRTELSLSGDIRRAVPMQYLKKLLPPRVSSAPFRAAVCTTGLLAPEQLQCDRQQADAQLSMTAAPNQCTFLVGSGQSRFSGLANPCSAPCEYSAHMYSDLSGTPVKVQAAARDDAHDDSLKAILSPDRIVHCTH